MTHGGRSVSVFVLIVLSVFARFLPATAQTIRRLRHADPNKDAVPPLHTLFGVWLIVSKWMLGRVRVRL